MKITHSGIFANITINIKNGACFQMKEKNIKTDSEISLRLYAFGTYQCGKPRREARDLGDMPQKHIDATIL